MTKPVMKNSKNGGIPLPRPVSTFDGNHLVSLTRVIHEDKLMYEGSLRDDKS
jgi:hypothetical protein